MPQLVALTGATGFVGGAILSELRSSNVQVRALSRQSRPDSDSVSWLQGGLHQPHILQQLVEDADVVIHCAGAVRGRSLKEFVSINNTGTINLRNACLQQSMPRRFLHISSLAAREPQLSWYAKSKRMAEAELLARPGPSTITILRPTAIYGPGDKEIRPLLRSLKVGFLTAPAVPSNFSLLHVHDLVAAIKKWLALQDFPGGVYELDDGSANGYNWESLIQLTNQVWGKSVFKISVPLALLEHVARMNLKFSGILNYSPMLTPGKVAEITHPDWVCDNRPLLEKLKWEPAIRLADAMNAPDLLQL